MDFFAKDLVGLYILECPVLAAVAYVSLEILKFHGAPLTFKSQASLNLDQESTQSCFKNRTELHRNSIWASVNTQEWYAVKEKIRSGTKTDICMTVYFSSSWADPWNVSTKIAPKETRCHHAFTHQRTTEMIIPKVCVRSCPSAFASWQYNLTNIPSGASRAGHETLCNTTSNVAVSQRIKPRSADRRKYFDPPLFVNVLTRSVRRPRSEWVMINSESTAVVSVLSAVTSRRMR